LTYAEDRGVRRADPAQQVLQRRAQQVLEVELLLEECPELAGHRDLVELLRDVLVGGGEVLAQRVQVLGDLFASVDELLADPLELGQSVVALLVALRGGHRQRRAIGHLGRRELDVEQVHHAAAQGLDGLRERVGFIEGDGLGAWRLRLQEPGQLQAVAVGQDQSKHDQVESLGRDGGAGLG
jgi:hypothetical protein